MWRLLFSKKADKQLSKLDPGVRRVLVSASETPRWVRRPRAFWQGALWATSPAFGATGMGDYRILCDIKDDELVVLALEVGHSSRSLPIGQPTRMYHSAEP